MKNSVARVLFIYVHTLVYYDIKSILFKFYNSKTAQLYNNNKIRRAGNNFLYDTAIIYDIIRIFLLDIFLEHIYRHPLYDKIASVAFDNVIIYYLRTCNICEIGTFILSYSLCMCTSYVYPGEKEREREREKEAFRTLHC
jgi:hypothetical protein